MHNIASLFLFLVLSSLLAAAEAGRGGIYSVVELAFKGPRQGPSDTPARDIDFRVRFQFEDATDQYLVHGFWDGGDVFKVRFTPTRPGRWVLAEVLSNQPLLNGQRQGDWVAAEMSRLRGFWLADEGSAGRRWYRRSDGSRQYVIGNTQYSFLSGYRDGGRPSGVNIASDVANNARYFKKLRFTFHGDRYVNPVDKPFLDDQGKPTDSGDFSHRPNPKWFSERADTAVRAAFDHDLIADLILCGPDTEESRSTLRAKANRGDAAPWLKYMAARYGAFPNVWMCVCNEYNIKAPRWKEEEIGAFGRALRGYLPFPTPLSVHPNSPTLWMREFDHTQPWFDHQIIQRKIREVPVAADVLHSVWQNAGGGGPRNKPTVNDELSYQGDGDRHNEGDTLEAHLGTFLGGGYGTSGFKSGNKLGHYFWGGFTPAEHTAARGLKFLRETIDAELAFWNMAPGADIFPDGEPELKSLSWPGQQYAAGTNRLRKGLRAELPPGSWTVKRFDIVAQQAATLAEAATGTFRFDAPDSRAVLFVFRKNLPAAASRQLLPLRVSGDRRSLATADGKPFFWLADTSWSMILRSSREDRMDQPSILRYFRNRAAKGFNVLQCWAVGNAKSADAYGHNAFVEGDFGRPLTVPGELNDYWDTVDWFVGQAREHGIYLALLPAWASLVPNDDRLVREPAVAYGYGRFLGERYRKEPHIVWVLGGDAPKDRDVDNPLRMAAARAMAEGIADGVNGVSGFDGKADYSTTLMTYHPRGSDSSSRLLHDEPWLDFNMIQTTTRLKFTNYEPVEKDYARTPVKPALDAEVAYECSRSLNRLEPQDLRTTPWEVRKAAYWNVLAGGLGHTYGHRSYIMLVRKSDTMNHGATIPWEHSLDAPGSFQMTLLKGLAESRGLLGMAPERRIFAGGEGEKMERAVARRAPDGSCTVLYMPTGDPVRLRMERIAGREASASWFDPRTGQSRKIGVFATAGEREFVPPTRGAGNDWVLVVEDAARAGR